jgi:hypothetical protein
MPFSLSKDDAHRIRGTLVTFPSVDGASLTSASVREKMGEALARGHETESVDNRPPRASPPGAVTRSGFARVMHGMTLAERGIRRFGWSVYLLAAVTGEAAVAT